MTIDGSQKLYFPLLIISMIFVFISLGQAESNKRWGRIVGYVRDRGTQKPIPYTNVFLNKTTYGSTTNSNGLFKIERVPAGNYHLVVRMMGFRPLIVRNLTVKPNDTRILNITLRRQVLRMKEVKVEADRSTGLDGIESSAVGMEVIDRKDIMSMPGAWEDATRAMTSLPSVRGRTDLNTLLYIRGGSPDQNLVLYDGLEILNPSRMILIMGGGVSICNPDVIQSITLSPGGFGAEHGDKMSALLEINTRAGRRNATSTKANLGLLSTGAIAEGPWAKGLGGWLVAGRRSFYDMLANKIYNPNYVFPFFYDLHAKVDYDISADDKIAVSYVHLGEGAKMTSIDSEQMDIINQGRGDIGLVKLNTVLNPKLATQILIGYYHELNKLNLYDTNNYLYNAQLQYGVKRASLRTDINYYPLTMLKLSTGVQVKSAKTLVDWNLNWRSYVELPATIQFDESYQNIGYYFQGRYKHDALFELTAGCRYDYSTLYNEAEWSPRLTVNVTPWEKFSFWAMSGMYYQFPDILTIIQRGEPLDITRNTSNLNAERAVHNIIGFEKLWESQYQLKLELYEKRFNGLLVAQDQIIYLPENSGKGQARGVEVTFSRDRLRTSKLGLWCNYSFSVARYHKNGESIWRYFDYDQRHALAVGADLRLYKNWSLSGVWRFGTGFPYTPLMAFKRELSSLQGVLAGWELLKDDTNSARYPNYNRFDLKLSYTLRNRQRYLTAYLDFINVFNSRNVYMYEWDFYRHQPSNGFIGKRTVIYMLPFVPSFGLSVGL